MGAVKKIPNLSLTLVCILPLQPTWTSWRAWQWSTRRCPAGAAAPRLLGVSRSCHHRLRSTFASSRTFCKCQVWSSARSFFLLLLFLLVQTAGPHSFPFPPLFLCSSLLAYTHSFPPLLSHFSEVGWSRQVQGEHDQAVLIHLHTFSPHQPFRFQSHSLDLVPEGWKILNIVREKNHQQSSFCNFKL